MRRIVHLSDLHFPIPDGARLVALADAVRKAAPSLIVITGDLTRAGRRREFAAAQAFVGSLPPPVFVVAGNHDVPVFNPAARLLRPLARFERYFPGDPVLSPSGGDVALARLDTVRGVSRSLDWSLGAIGERALARLALALSRVPATALRMVACHHPLIADPADPYRSRTRGGAAALQALGALDVSILFHGHLHRSSVRLLPAGRRPVLCIGAGTLSDRERGAGLGFNLVTIEAKHVTVGEIHWSGGHFAQTRCTTHVLPTGTI